MNGSITLADGTRFAGVLHGPARTAIGWLAANTAVVGFQEMVTDPAYKGRLLVFTYPEIGNVGMTAAFSESPRVQVAGLVVKCLSEFRSHYRSEESFARLLERDGIPCLSEIDTRALAVYIREHGEQPAAIAPEGVNADTVKKGLAALGRPVFEAPATAAAPKAQGGPAVAVVNLGVRWSELQQLGRCCKPILFSFNADPAKLHAASPAAVIVSDGPGDCAPPKEAVRLIEALLGKTKILGYGLGHVALGMALGCKPAFLKRGHHGANYPVRCTADGKAEVTHQAHSVLLDRSSVESSSKAKLLWENINDQSVEGIVSTDGTAVGLQFIPAAPQAGTVNEHFTGLLAR